MTPAEIAANALNTASIILAGRNSMHTWWTGILGCAVFGWVFFGAKLYGDAALQVFFIGASLGGWWNWTRRRGVPELPIRRTPPRRLAALGALSLALTALNAWLLSRFTDAAAPVPDSAVLAFSVLGQFLLMGRRIETWWCWLVVNSVAVPLFIGRGLHLTAGLYALYWVNAIISLRVWQRKLCVMSKEFSRGLVVGKFCPLHLGHESVIRRAMEQCDEVFVLSYTNPEFPGCEPDKRRAWLAARFPSVHPLVLEACDGLPPNDADDATHRQFTARICRERFGTSVDAVFTSEAYGDGFAAELAREFGHPVAHVMVDAARSAVPISGTRLREDIHGHRGFVAPEVYASFVQRVAILGGESSGKTTLAAALAEHFGTVWVPEFGRELWVERGGHLRPEDLSLIAHTQIAREETACYRANRFVFCDTTPLTTLFYSQAMFGDPADSVVEAARRAYNFTILCAPDFTFVQDGTRQDTAFRQRQHEWYLERLAQLGLRYHIAEGTLPRRLHECSDWISAAAAQHEPEALTPSASRAGG